MEVCIYRWGRTVGKRAGLRLLAAVCLAALLYGAASLAAPGILPGAPHRAEAALVSPETTFLYVTAGKVRAFRADEFEFATLAESPDVAPVMPSRALSGAAVSYTLRPLDGPMRTYITEEVTDPGVPTEHEFVQDLQFPGRLSPDGSTFLYNIEEFIEGEGVTNTLYLWSLATESTTFKLDWVDGADWSPDGTRIAFVSYPRAIRDEPDYVMLYVYDRGTGLVSEVPTARLRTLHEVNIHAPRWSPSGQWIAFQRYDYPNQTVSVVRTDPAGTAETVMFTGPMGSIGQGMEWIRMPDGTERLYVETLVPGGAPFVLKDVGGVGSGGPGPDVLHGAFTYLATREFSDVNRAGTFGKEIYDLATLRIVGGFEDGTFRPADPVKRMQYAKMISIALGIHDAPWTAYTDPTFPDVPPPAAKDEDKRYPFDYVEEAAAANLIKGDTSGRFNPGANITRVQLALMITRAAWNTLEPPTPADYQAFTDTAGLTQEARDAVARAYHNGIIKGKTATTFQPYGTATRGQVSVMTWRLMALLGLLG